MALSCLAASRLDSTFLTARRQRTGTIAASRFAGAPMGRWPHPAPPVPRPWGRAPIGAKTSRRRVRLRVTETVESANVAERNGTRFGFRGGV
eukprot:5984167-Prymnesium_polylepis.2